MKNKELKEALLAMILFGHMLEDVLEDGKIKIREIFESIDETKDLIEALKNTSVAVKQYIALNDEGKADLIKYVRDEIDLENDKVESLIEKLFAWLVASEQVIKSIKEIRE